MNQSQRMVAYFHLIYLDICLLYGSSTIGLLQLIDGGRRLHGGALHALDCLANLRPVQIHKALQPVAVVRLIAARRLHTHLFRRCISL